MDVVSLAALAALVVKIVGVVKAIGKDRNLVWTQVVTWVVGIGVLFLAAEAELTEHLVLFAGAAQLRDLDPASIVLAGLALGSSGSFAYDVKKAIDGADNAREPRLLT